MLYLARGIEDDHYWVVEEIDGVLVDASWRIEHEPKGYTLSHADERAQTVRVERLGWFETPGLAIDSLRAFLLEN